ncbi:MAG TPA: PIG-L family deacetylase [Cyclobacteriaceae bacterium]|nr:PIG-L family deacetylase [Cyclobacteriaceae bacterium]HMV09131.1 PIG-L family deacetylase [Cyclobacteriaceae bacterium]HMV91742.1 PIG-L family deacetylase [Cyclobacteriaceae bacterium]HMX01500.1 PIG-L family deacetylase [Cyclobacteriaceae bacterium]HMX50230.1 PIG-L family deacetylase [Cyclobacteriaceae bacterium]
MKNRILVSCLLVFACTPQLKHTPPANNKILVILAHPDDETAVAPVLAKYAADHDVYLAIATDGRYGYREHAGIPKGDSLVAVRVKEAVCSCKAMGIHAPILLGFHDGSGMVTGIGEYFRQTEAMREKVKSTIEEIDPGVIITFGPDGDTGHLDHRGIGDITTEVILREGWYEKYPVYYIGWTKDKIVSLPQNDAVNTADESYLNIRIPYSEADEEKLFAVIQCHKSQFSPSEITDWIETERKDTVNVAYFRQLVLDRKVREGF